MLVLNISKFEHQVVFHKIEWNQSFVPEVTYSIRVARDIDVKLFYTGVHFPLPACFRERGKRAKLTSNGMFQNLFPTLKERLKNMKSYWRIAATKKKKCLV